MAGCCREVRVVLARAQRLSLMGAPQGRGQVLGEDELHELC